MNTTEMSRVCTMMKRHRASRGVGLLDSNRRYGLPLAVPIACCSAFFLCFTTSTLRDIMPSCADVHSGCQIESWPWGCVDMTNGGLTRRRMDDQPDSAPLTEPSSVVSVAMRPCLFGFVRRMNYAISSHCPSPCQAKMAKAETIRILP